MPEEMRCTPISRGSHPKKVHLRRYQFLDGGKGVLEYDAGYVAFILIPICQTNRHCAANALAINNHLCISKFVPLADVVQAGLRVNHEPLFVGVAG